MKNVTAAKPGFGGIGDQQLLDQTKRLAANRCFIEVHILDHLDEIDRRGLALRRGFSSLFDYTVRELRFADASAQRRIQAMRLCRRHGWVRAELQKGKLNLTSAAQLETLFATAERLGQQEVEWRGKRLWVGSARPPDSGRRSAGLGRESAGMEGVAAAGATRLNESVSPPPASSSAVPQPAPQPRSSSPARSEASLATSPEAASAVPPVQSPSASLRDPRHQRDLIEQAVGLSTRQVADLIATAAPQMTPRRDTLRSLGNGTFTLKLTIDEECQSGLHLLKGLLAHHDPRMSWSDLVARLVREAVERHDPRRGGGRRRRSAGDAGESPARAGGAPPPATGNAAPAEEYENGSPDGDPGAAGAADECNIAPVRKAAPDVGRGDEPARMVAAVAPAATSAPEPVLARAAAQARAATSAPEPVLAVTAVEQTAPGASAQARAATPAPERDSIARRREDNAVEATAGPRVSSRRAIPAAVRRLVWQRDQGRCSYRDPLTGRHCSSSHMLQIDHLLPVAQGGGSDPENLRLACFAHHRERHRGGLRDPASEEAGSRAAVRCLDR